MRLLRALGHAIAMASAAWWAVALGALGLSAVMHPMLALLLVSPALGLTAVLAAPAGATALRQRLAIVRPDRRALLAALLVACAWPAVALVQSLLRVPLRMAPEPGSLALPGRMLVEAWGAQPVAAALALGLLLPAGHELLFRGVMLPRLCARAGNRWGLVLTALASTACWQALPGPPRDHAIVAAAFGLAWLLGVLRLRTGSTTASVLAHVGCAAIWMTGALAPAVSPPVAWALAAAGLACGVLGWRLLARSRARDEPVAPMTREVARREPAGPPPRFAWPWVGATFGAGLVVGECVVVVKGMLASFAGRGIGQEIAVSVATCVALGAAGDLLVQAMLPARWRTPLARGLALLPVALLLEHRFGLFAIAALGVVPLAALWTVSCRVRWSRPLAAAIVVFALTGRGSSGSAEPPATIAADARPTPRTWPSIAVIVLDTVRHDRTSLHGNARDTTPRLDALAARGTRFDRAYSSSCWSVPSHASLFTGLVPHHHGATFEAPFLDGKARTLAEALAAAGYETAGISANPYIARATGMARGFASYQDLWRPWVMSRGLTALRLADLLRTTPPDKGGADVVEAVRAWHQARDARRPYFLFVNIMEAHAPYQDAPDYAAFAADGASRATRRRLRAAGRAAHDAQWLGTRVDSGSIPLVLDAMDGATLSADAYLGRVLEILGPDTTVVVLSDHGDLVGEHDLHGHMTSLYDALIRIPLVIAGPGIARGHVVAGAASIVDIMPTLLARAGLDPAGTDGQDLAPALRGEEIPHDRLLLAEHYRNPELRVWAQHRTAAELAPLMARKAAVISGHRKRVVSEDGSDHGYWLDSDPGELRPLPGAQMGLPALVPAAGGGASFPQGLDPAQLEALRALGYVR